MAYTKMTLVYETFVSKIEDFHGAPQVTRALGVLVKKVMKASGLDVEAHAVGWVGPDFASADKLEAKVRAEAEVHGPKALPSDIERAKHVLALARKP